MTDTEKGGPALLPTDFDLKVPEGDEHERLVCNHCGWIHYVNPRIVVGSVCQWDDKFLICRRRIEPRAGYWTIPAGFLEEKETAEHGGGPPCFFFRGRSQSRVKIITIILSVIDFK